MTPRHVLVIGGGIAGLTAAHRLRELAGDACRVTIVDRDDRLGGKLRTGRLAGVAVETGAESFLVRRPEAADLVRALGLSHELVHPRKAPAAVWSHGELRPIPPGTMQGVPSDPARLEGVVSAAAAARPESPAPDRLLDDSDIAVGRLVRASFGDEVTDRLVDPMLGGVYAGRADDLSLEMTMPQLAAAARRHDRLSEAVAECLPTPSAAPAPVFGALAGGMSRLVERLAAAGEAERRLGLPIRRLERTETGWRALRGDTRDPEVIEADAVILALPARPAARLLGSLDESAADTVGALDYASVALVAMELPGASLPDLSGFLVPAVEGFEVKAATFMTRKWPHLSDDRTIVRMSLGRYGQERVLQREDSELISLAHRELSTMVNTTIPAPGESGVYRWGGALPQYAPGHGARVADVRERLASHPLALAGAAFDGVGIPACIASGRAAAEVVWRDADGGIAE